MLLDTLNKYYDEGWLIKQTHPTKDLTIWNYSRQTQWEDHWDEITLMCRGLVTNSKGDIVSRCFKKFFNWEQLESVGVSIPNEEFDLYEKMDGQLGLLFWYEDQWIFASRGSFTSMYAERAWQLLQQYDYHRQSHELTYIFEIIFKEGRIVCKYDFEDLILLGAIRISDGVEIDIHSNEFKNLAGFKLVKKYDSVADFQTLKDSIDPNAEGYVLRFKKGLERFSRRMKIKGVEYCRLHSIITKISSRDIWEFLKDGKPMDELLEHVPDEFDAWVRDQIDILTKSYHLIEYRLRDRYECELNTEDVTCKKDFALKVLKEPKENRGVYFNMYDGRDYKPLIWNKIYPKYSKPFTMNDTEGDDN
jgi:hypothetical protein